MLTAYYDLARNPPTFDVVTFLLTAERERIKRNEQQIAIEILPGPDGGFRRDRLWPRSLNERRAMLCDVVIPMCEMLPSAKSIKVCYERPAQAADNSFGFDAYTVALPSFVRAMSEGIRPLRPATPSAMDPRLVTITLRECEHHPLRNSNVAQWHKAAIELSADGYDVVVLRDARLFNEPLSGCQTLPIASRELASRADLYCRAVCNMFVSNGPAWFACALDAPVLIFRPTTDAAGGLYSAANLASCGVLAGGDLPNAPIHQKLVWSDDTSEIIVNTARKVLHHALPDVRA